MLIPFRDKLFFSKLINDFFINSLNSYKGVASTNFNIGDIVKYEHGVFEIEGICEHKYRPYTLNNGRDQYFASDDDLVLICNFKDRRDD